MNRHYSPLGGLYPYPEERFIWDGLRERWSQLNEKTKISFTNQTQIYLADIEPLSIQAGLIRVAVSGWKRFKRYLFFRDVKPIFSGVTIEWQSTSELLDNPDERWKYTTRLWQSALYAPVPIFWRSVGRLFKNKNWYNRGTELQDSPIVPTKPKGRLIQLQRFAVQFNRIDRNPYDNYISLAVGYDSLTDTLFIKRLS